MGYWQQKTLIRIVGWWRTEQRKGHEHCVELYMNYGKLNDGKWNDNRCDLEQPYICMKRKLTNKKWIVY